MLWLITTLKKQTNKKQQPQKPAALGVSRELWYSVIFQRGRSPFQEGATHSHVHDPNHKHHFLLLAHEDVHRQMMDLSMQLDVSPQHCAGTGLRAAWFPSARAGTAAGGELPQRHPRFGKRAACSHAKGQACSDFIAMKWLFTSEAFSATPIEL